MLMIPVDEVGTETTEEAAVGPGKTGTANALNALKGRVKVSRRRGGGPDQRLPTVTVAVPAG